jgi:hypothetical protein
VTLPLGVQCRTVTYRIGDAGAMGGTLVYVFGLLHRSGFVEGFKASIC